MRKKLRIAVGGSASDPQHLGHLKLVETILQSGQFDVVRWVISGIRSDKPKRTPADHRVTMGVVTFPYEWFLSESPKFVFDYEGAEKINVPTIVYLEQLREKYKKAEITFFTGVDVLVPQEEFGGKCAVEAFWVRGKELLKNWRWCVLPRDPYPHPSTLNLPKNFTILDKPQLSISSTDIRKKIANGKPFEDLVTEKVANCIKDNKLYGYKKVGGAQ